MRLGDLDALKEKVNAFYDELFVGCVSSDLITYAQGVDCIIDNAPTIQSFTLEDIEEQYRKGLEKGLSEWETERPQGEWLDGGGQFLCNFCPNCGAEMQKDKMIVFDSLFCGITQLV